MAKTIFPNHMTEEEAKASFASKSNPEFTGSISMGRKSGSVVGRQSVAIGNNAIARGYNSFAHGNDVVAQGVNSFVSGRFNDYSLPSASDWVSETHYKVGDLVNHSGTVYECIIENTDKTFSYQKWSALSEKYAETIGNGTSDYNRSNARTLDWRGNEWLAGSLTLGSTTLTEEKLQQLLALLS